MEGLRALARMGRYWGDAETLPKWLFNVNTETVI